MWKQRVAKQVRLGVLAFVLLIYLGIASQRHLLEGVDTVDFALALGCVVVAVSPIFLTMGFLLKDSEPDLVVDTPRA